VIRGGHSGDAGSADHHLGGSGSHEALDCSTVEWRLDGT
jgi:hypothetical protein